MATYKNITIKKRGGGTRLQRVKVLKSGKFKFVKNIGRKLRKRTSRTRKANPTRRRGVRRMARRKTKRRQRTIAVAPLLGLVGGLQDPIQRAVAGDFMGALHESRNIITGFDEFGGWNPQWMAKFWGPVIGGVLMHKVANFIGVNRQFAKLPSPLNKLRL